MVSVCATAVVNLFAIKPIAVLVAVCFAGPCRGAKSYWGWVEAEIWT